MSKKESSDLKINSLERSKVVLKTTLKLGSQKAKNKIAKSLLKNTSKSVSEEETEIAEIIFKGLCQLRGTAMKLAQFLSSQSGLLKPEHLEVLRQSHYQVPPLNAVIISKMIRNEFKIDKEQLFLEFEDQAFAAASLGQVHKAKLKDGTLVAVKIQYPGIDQSVAIDINLIKKILTAVPRNKNILNSLNSIESRLKEEVDYTIEKQYAEKFYNHYQFSLISIPQVYSAFSSKRIITYEFMTGQSIPEWLKSNPHEEQKNQIGQLIWNFFCDSIFKFNTLHCDPNLGNFLIQDNLKLTVLDFGCIQDLPKETVQLFKELWKADHEDSVQTLVTSYIQLGASIKDHHLESFKIFYNKVIFPYKNWMNKITTSTTFDFSLTPGLSLEGQKILFKETFEPSMNTFSPEFTLIHRTFFGVLQILETLGAKIKINQPIDQSTGPF